MEKQPQTPRRAVASHANTGELYCSFLAYYNIMSQTSPKGAQMMSKAFVHACWCPEVHGKAADIPEKAGAAFAKAVSCPCASSLCKQKQLQMAVH